MPEAVLFDLDGTLADTAPDLAGTTNQLLSEENRPPKAYAELRPYASQGVRGLLRTGFGIEPAHPDYPRLFERFLDIYASRICAETRLFDGIPELLERIERQGLHWGIVTNKRQRYTDPLVERLGLTPRTRCVVSGDTTSAAKPSPLPVLHACALLDCQPQHSVFVGDDPRDIEAGRAAGCLTVAVGWGYLGDNAPIGEWGADLVIEHPAQLAAFLDR